MIPISADELLLDISNILGADTHPELHDEKQESLARFLRFSISRLRQLASTHRGVLFLGFLFEELVRSESEFYLETDLEREVESFILSCLENRDEYGVLERRLWHVPDVLGFKIKEKEGVLNVKRIVEVKTSPTIIKDMQVRGHENDVRHTIEQINLRRNIGLLPPLIESLRISLSDHLEKIVVIPRGSKVGSKVTERLSSEDWLIKHSVFSRDEAIFLAKKLFPETSSYWLDYTLNPQPTDILPTPTSPLKDTAVKNTAEVNGNVQELFDESFLRLDGFLGHFSAFLQGLFESAYNKRYEREDLLEIALIWLCSDRIIVDPSVARQIIKYEELEESNSIEEDLPARFRELLKKIDIWFLKPENAESLVNFIYRLDKEKIEPAMEAMDPKLYLDQNALKFI